MTAFFFFGHKQLLLYFPELALVVSVLQSADKGREGLWPGHKTTKKKKKGRRRRRRKPNQGWKAKGRSLARSLHKTGKVQKQGSREVAKSKGICCGKKRDRTAETRDSNFSSSLIIEY